MSVHDAEPGDIYVDLTGKLWRVIAVCHQPTVTAEEVEGHLPSANNFAGAQVGIGQAIAGLYPPQPQIVKARMSGSTSGFMWSGFKRIWRREKA